ncbi:MAG: hypothetical protein ABIR33_08225 [Pyrinomonadaceae bacterium]
MDEKKDFFEVRLHRWTALEGGETFILRRIGNEWSGSLIGDGKRFSCFYQHAVKPKVVNWNQVYESLVQAGILELSGKEPNLGWEDGNVYNLEVTVNGKVTHYSVFLADKQKSVSAKRIQEIGPFVSTTFETPMFIPEYDRGTVGEYLIENCKGFRK